MYYIKESTDLSNIFDTDIFNNKKRVYLTTNEYKALNREKAVDKMAEIIKSYIEKAEVIYKGKFEKWEGIVLCNGMSNYGKIEYTRFDIMKSYLDKSIDDIKPVLPERSMIYVEYTLKLKRDREGISYPLTFMTYFRVLDDVKYTELLL